MFSSSFLPVLYGVCLLATQVKSNVIRSPSQSPSLTFQVEPNDSPSLDDSSWETWPRGPFDSPQDISSDTGLEAALRPQHRGSFDPPVTPPLFWSKTPVPVGIPFSNLFQNALNRFLSFAIANNDLNVHLHPQLPEPIDCSKYTIGEVLEWTLAHTPKPSADDFHHPPSLHRLAWLVNISHPIQQVLKDPHANLTLFAPDDKALTPPWKRKHHSGKEQLEGMHGATQIDQVADEDASHTFWDALDAMENEFESGRMRQANLATGLDDEGKEKKKKIFLHVIESVLKYHVSPGRKTLHEIGDSSTLPTALPISHESGSPPFRVRVGLPLPHLHHPGELTLNFFSRYEAFKTRPIVAKNGVIYIIERVPLLPPLSPLSQLFLFPQTTSTLTSAIQKTHLDDALLPHWGNKTVPLSAESSPHSDLTFEGSLETVDERVQSVLSGLIDGHDCDLKKESFTIFAPTNHAFRSLGPAANAFLFSPFGQHILRYVLSYHVVPNLIWNTDHCDKIEQGQTAECHLESTTYQTVDPLASFGPFPFGNQYLHPHHPHPAHPGKVHVTELLLPTLLGSRANESLPISLVEFRHGGRGPLIRRVYIKPNGKDLTFGPPDKRAIPVSVADAVAWGGAIHVIPKLIHPPVPAGHHKRKDVQRAVELSILSPA